MTVCEGVAVKDSGPSGGWSVLQFYIATLVPLPSSLSFMPRAETSSEAFGEPLSYRPKGKP